MTREEILNTPEIVDFMIDKSVMVESKMKLHKRLDELCKLAIKALEQEPCDDCISRQAVLDKAVYTETEEGWSGMTVDVKDIEALPPVDPQNTGYWILEKWNNKEHYSCSRIEALEMYKRLINGLPGRRMRIDEFPAVLDKAVYTETEEGWSGMTVDVKDIEALPPVKPQEPKTGYWIKYGIPRCGEQHYKCTNCDEYFNFGLYSDYYKKAFKYCPNCGAKMVESQESEDRNDT